MKSKTLGTMAVSAFLALAAWPAYFAAHARVTPPQPAPLQTTAPVVADYAYRNGIIADLETQVRRHPDQLDTRMLAGQYLQRYREAPDVGDLLRAAATARRSMQYQPRNNIGAEAVLVSVYTALHKFRLAKRYADDVIAMTPWNSEAAGTAASLSMELGDYTGAKKLLSTGTGSRTGEAWYTVAARYAELTGNLSAARELIARAMAEADANVSSPAEARAWYHWRAGELAFAAGNLERSQTDFKDALSIFPHYWHATNGLAKIYWAQRRWPQALAAATQSADVYPLPETLGYKADAQRGLGDVRGALATGDLISAIERIGAAQGINDRLIAVYDSEHGVDPGHAVRIARRDLSTRDDIYAEDTLAWALAMDGRWKEARAHAQRAASLGTQDARLQFHVAMIELHNGEREAARRRLTVALTQNPYFHPVYARVAATRLAKLNAGR